MSAHWQKKVLITVLSVLLVGIAASGCALSSPSPLPNPSTPIPAPTPAPSSTQTTKPYVYIDGGIVVRGSGEPIELINNPYATNPTFAELVAFIERDRTDEYSYIVGPPKNAFVCSDFAETVHNNAEVAGIRAAWVGIDIEGETEGHAINAFETTDLGLVYIDCTGKGFWNDPENRSSWDRRVRVEIGKPYAVADIDKAKTRFQFLINQPIGADDMVMEELEEHTLRSLKLSGWIRIRDVGEREQKSLEMLEWLRTHDIEDLGQKWIQDWIREYEAELSRCNHEEFEIKESHGSRSYYGTISEGAESHVTSRVWYVLVDCLDTSWFQPVETLIDVDGIPIVWQISWEMSASWYKPFGNKVIKDIHIHWGE